MVDKDNKAERDAAYWLALAALKGMGSALFRHLRLLKLEKSFPLDRQTVEKLSDHPAFSSHLHLNGFDLEQGKRLREHHWKKGIHILHWDSPEYPQEMAESPFAPPLLTWKGNQWPNMANHPLAMVGTRTPGPWAPAICRLLCESLQGHPVTILSGLAQGIDSFCHQAALEQGLQTQAVLAQGLDLPITGSRGVLANRILESGGTLISPFLAGSPSLKPRFVQRNQIIAALARAIVLVESREDGGAMHTVRFAHSIPRPVIAVPGDIWRESAQGGNALLRAGKAQPLWKPADLPGILNLPPRSFSGKMQASWPAGLEKYRGKTLTLQELQKSTGYPMHELLAILTHLEMQACCRVRDGQWIHFS